VGFLLGRYKAQNPTVSKGFSFKPDVLEMLKDQSNEAGLTMSAYLERLILEKHYTAKALSEDSSDSE
jgi:hypothetical protein